MNLMPTITVILTAIAIVMIEMIVFEMIVIKMTVLEKLVTFSACDDPTWIICTTDSIILHGSLSFSAFTILYNQKRSPIRHTTHSLAENYDLS